MAKSLAAGLMAMDFCPESMAEGQAWRFLGIQSKNRKEWFLLHLANMYIGVTTCALYDTLGEQAMRYVVNQTELTTVAMSSDLITKMFDLVQKDKEDVENRKLHRLKNIISFEKPDDSALQLGDELGIRIITFDQVLKAG